MTKTVIGLGWALSLSVWGCAAPRAQVPAQALAAPVPESVASAPSSVISTDVASLARPVTSFGAAVHAGALYTYGGYFGVPHAYSREGQSGDLVRVDVEGRSETLLAREEGVQGAQLVSTQVGLLRVGGMRALNAEGEPERIVSLSDVARFDEASQVFRALPSLPEPRSSHAVAVHQGELFVLGGWILNGDRKTGRFAESVLVLDLETGSYRSIPQPAQLRAAQAVVLDGQIVLLGGLDGKGQTLQSVHVLDPKTGAWSRGPELPSEAFGVAATSNGKTVFASARDGVVYALHGLSGAWQAQAYLAFPRFFHQMVMLDETTLGVLGGISGMHGGSRIAHIERIDMESQSPRILNWTLKNPSAAKNRQGVQVMGDALVAFGGNRSLAQHDFGPQDFSAAAFAIDLATMQPSPLPDYPAARQTVQTLAMQDALLAVGGFGHDGEKARSHADAYAYDFAQRVWKPYGSILPAPRTQFGLAAYGERLWVFGGLDYDPTRADDKAQFIHPVTVLTAKRGEPFVESSVKLPRPRRAFAGAAHDGKYFMVGGMADGFAKVAECDVFDFEQASWSSMACPLAPRISAQLVPLDGLLYLAGGSTATGAADPTPNRALEAYDPASNGWTTLLETIPSEPRHLSALAYHHALLLYSAQHADDRIELTLIVPSRRAVPAPASP